MVTFGTRWQAKKNYKSIVTKAFVLAFVLTLFLPSGILLIIFGAGKNTAMLVCGIAMTVLGFYGSPIAWGKYGDSKHKNFVYRPITNENMYTVEDISAQTTYPQEKVTDYINDLIAKRYITGFFFKDEKLILNTNKKKRKTRAKK